MTELKSCACNAAPKLIFSCSGAADVGEVADSTVRQLTREGVGKMYCLAGIGGRCADILTNTRQASAILAIDGCRSACASKTLREAGFDGFIQIQLADLGLQKGNAPATSTNIERVASAARQAFLNSKGEAL